MRSKSVFLLAVLTIAAAFVAQDAISQDEAQAAKIYKSCSGSVLFLTVKSETGEILGQASGFVIQGGLIVTNEHVARKGNVYIETGVAVIPTSQTQVDAFNDLALLRPGVELAVTPLAVINDVPSPGDSVFTIGNPAGLEKSISTGVVSNVREIEGRELIQITSPISPGSSGGPVLNERGEVVGVAVGVLRTGQNLNFAVPAKKVLDLVSGKPAESWGAPALIAKAKSLQEDMRKLAFSFKEDSEYQRTRAKLRTVLEDALKTARKSLPDLMALYDLASGYASDIAVLAAEKAVELSPGFDTKFKLGQALAAHAYWLEDHERGSALKRAEGFFRDCQKLSKAPNAGVIKALADVLEGLGNHAEAAQLFAEANSLYGSGGDKKNQAGCLRGLIRTSYALGNKHKGDTWFKALVSSGHATSWDWSLQGKRLENLNEFHDAALAYQTAASLDPEYGWYFWLDAACMYWMSVDDYDNALACARKCIALGSQEDYAEDTLALCHRLIANILNKRGVYQDALNHARESIALDPEEGWAYDVQAEALIGLHRYLEAVKACEQAIRLTDGKYSLMHFHLGDAHFELKNWEQAYQSYELAAEFDKKDTSAPYNMALCALKMNRYYDASRWFEEVLRRNPNYPERQEILRRIEALKR